TGSPSHCENGFPHLLGRLTTTAPSGFRQPFVRRSWIRFGIAHSLINRINLYRERLNAVLAVDELWCEARRMLRVAQLSWRLPRKFLMAENRFPQRLEHLVPVPLPAPAQQVGHPRFPGARPTGRRLPDLAAPCVTGDLLDRDVQPRAFAAAPHLLRDLDGQQVKCVSDDVGVPIGMPELHSQPVQRHSTPRD